MKRSNFRGRKQLGFGRYCPLSSSIRRSPFAIHHPRAPRIPPRGRLLSFVLVPLLFAGCAVPVHVDTPEPIKVDISMKVDIYQSGATAASTQRKISEEENKALRRRDDRSGQIWTMKNDGVVIEGAKGYLEAQTKSGWDPAYINKLVAEENQDRRILYEAEATSSARPVSVIEEEAGRRLRQQAYGRKP